MVPIDDLVCDVHSDVLDAPKKVRANIDEGHRVIADPSEKKFAPAHCSRHEGMRVGFRKRIILVRSA